MTPPVILVIDDDISVRRGVTRLLGSAGYRTETYASADEFLARPVPPGPTCVVLDIAMPGVDGLELQERMQDDGRDLPIVFVTGKGDVPSSVRAMKHGAVDFLLKPFTADQLLGAVSVALERGRKTAAERQELAGLQARFDTLTAREREVFSLIVVGLLNKQVASRLGTSEKTVKAHRARVMEKMTVGSFAELVRAAERLEHAPGAAPAAEPLAATAR